VSGELALRAEGLGKEYQLGERRFAAESLYEALASWLPGARPAAAEAGERGRFWALREVSFDVARGEVIGIVGRNGAGKSTLLKILSRITAPTTGRAVLHGKLASLLEVGTGFHPDLTGRENIYLNGTILGMRRREIDRKFDDIAAFAEVERFLDTPVKRYSSGMYVRLAFAVAAHLETDILVVDEVLAVGDLAFQRKSLGKMEDVAKSGRTVLFVSHNLGAVRTLCSSVLLLEGGRVAYRGPTEEGLARYEASLADGGAAIAATRFAGPLAGRVGFHSFALRQGGEEVAVLDPTQPVEIEIGGEATEDLGTLELNLGVMRDGVRLFSCHDAPPATPLRRGAFRSRFEVAAGVLRPGRYLIGVGAYRPGGGDWTWCPEVAVVEVSERWSTAVQSRDLGLLSVPYRAERVQ
jgi:lipopolysaccharide transport system ATP-binding protein